MQYLSIHGMLFCFHNWTYERLEIFIWLVVSTHLKNISQIGSFPQVGIKIKNV